MKIIIVLFAIIYMTLFACSDNNTTKDKPSIKPTLTDNGLPLPPELQNALDLAIKDKEQGNANYAQSRGNMPVPSSPLYPPSPQPEKKSKMDSAKTNNNRAKDKGKVEEAPALLAKAESDQGEYEEVDVEPKNTENYKDYGIRSFISTKKEKLSTFSIDVDTASYSISRRKINEGVLPPKDAVRVEEFINYFKYKYDYPTQDPFSVNLVYSPSPFDGKNYFLRIGVQGKKVSDAERMPVHLTFLVDTSGSMNSEDKLGLVKKSLILLVNNLKQGDTVALCTYAGSVRLVLLPTGIENKERIIESLSDLFASGSTSMSSGMQLAYALAYKTLFQGHISRVIVCSDGDANVGATSHEQILKFIEKYKEKGITLTTLGFGMGNYKDTMMEQLANKGNGNYYYVDSIAQANKVFGENLTGTLQVIAKDVKIQVEFNPENVEGYRLVGYENRNIANKDFRNDKVDAGEIGAGHNVTAIYELKLINQNANIGIVRIRNKPPTGDTATEKTFPITSSNLVESFNGAPSDYRFCLSVMAFAEKLRNSPYSNKWSMNSILNIAKASTNETPEQIEFLELLNKAVKMIRQ